MDISDLRKILWFLFSNPNPDTRILKQHTKLLDNGTGL